MGLDDLKDKATEKASDAGIQKAGDAVEEKTGGKGEEQINQGEQAADRKIGE